MAVPEILARDAHPPVALRARRVEDLVVVAAQVLDGNVRKRGWAATRSKAAVTALIFWWSGATPARTRP
jgi:hypothetical protein